MKMLQLVLILLVLSGVFTQHSKWGVKYPDKPICAVRGFSVSIKCSYYYPRGHQVIQKLWCSMNLNTDLCKNPPYVYDSSLNTKSDFDFTGDDKSDCTLLIHNVQFNYSGVYRFRFITDVTGGKLTGYPGATLQVTDLKVSLIRLSGNGTLKQGDSLNLTCDVSCTHTSSQFVWSKNNQRLYTSGPVLHFPALTLRDSGDYTCTWGTGETSGSKTISLHVEGESFDQWKIWIIIFIVVVILVIVATVIYLRRKRERGEENTQDGANTHDKQPKPQPSSVPQLDDETLPEEEVTYARVCVKDKKVTQRCTNTEQQKEDDNVIYSAVIKS
ncbi:uncharacterized protein LOC125140230 [Tachysurus fulvidraco]|uniref:uncharacterized protein LOC125140230 n=1 Tax=Tachysurus fulvidraco TaxID=1234273 RepID=UPI001FEFBAF6|nr:uncharacterized protein LOC125140230 [Tachysurus fulvidraco]